MNKVEGFALSEEARARGSWGLSEGLTVVSNALLSTPASSNNARARMGSAKAGHLRQDKQDKWFCA
jgi:hypothetical protein